MLEKNPWRQEIRMTLNGLVLKGNLALPDQPKAIVIFAHGSGSSRFSTRNRYVASVLEKGGLATLLMDLLTETEEEIDQITASLRFNIPLLAERVLKSAAWIKREAKTKGLPIGYFGASTGAAAALIAAAKNPEGIFAVASRGGRPDLAMDYLSKVRAPTLLIVGGDDEPVIGMNREAERHLVNAPHYLEIIPGATHLFEEPGTLEKVAFLARDWFLNQLAHQVTSPEIHAG